MDFLTLKPESFGLDISDLSLKIIKLKKRGKFFDLASFGEEKIKPGIIKNGEIRDKEALIKIIKEGLIRIKGEKLNTKYVIASLPEEKAFLQIIQMPKIPEEDLKSAIIYEAENYIPFPIEEIYLDFQIISPLLNHLNHYDILLAALPKKIIDSYLYCLKNSGLIPKALEIEALSIVRALIKNEVSSSVQLLIDLGATRTGFIVFAGYSLRFVSSIPVSSEKFNENISKNLNIDSKKAEELKIKYGLTGEKKIFEAIVPVLTDLTEQIKKYIDYYQAHACHEHLISNEKTIEKIYLSGRGANLKGLTDFLSRELKIPVELGNPWINILPESFKETPKLSLEESLGYTTALGLALRGIKEI